MDYWNMFWWNLKSVGPKITTINFDLGSFLGLLHFFHSFGCISKLDTPKKIRTEMVALVRNPMEQDFLKASVFWDKEHFVTKKNAIFPMCNKLPIIQSNLPLGLIHSPHVPSNVGIHRRFWPCFNRKIHWKGGFTIRFSQKCDIFGWSQSTMKIYYINIRSEKLSLRKGWLQWSGSKISAWFLSKKHPLHCASVSSNLQKKHCANWDFQGFPAALASVPNLPPGHLHAPSRFFSARNPKEKYPSWN